MKTPDHAVRQFPTGTKINPAKNVIFEPSLRIIEKGIISRKARIMDPNKEVFLEQVQIHKRIIYKICHAYCKAGCDIEDLAQEIIYQLWKSFDHYNSNLKFSTWMYRIALNVAISYYRNTKKFKAHVNEPVHLLELADETGDGEAMEANITMLQQFINELKELDRALMILYLEENSYSEIADIIGISETNVATKISRIKEKLKQRFNTQNP
ncbi:MAG: sigma-70 family RNA polymerase sigma factor [Chitinophagaceae bacterium]